MKKSHKLVNDTRVTSLVTAQRGSWEWQDAFRIATYRIKLIDDGRAIWISAWQTGKLSMPQINRHDYRHDYVGSLHNKQVARTVALKQIGANAVRYIEQHGWRFA